MPLYFAYGSNCNADVLERKEVRFTSRRRATLRGYRLQFNKKSERELLPDVIGFANINEYDEGTVEGILYEIVEEDLPALDASERHPTHYNRVMVTVETESETIECWSYKAQPDMVADGLVPSRNYLNHILAGREFLSQQYFEALDRSRTYSGDCCICVRTGEVFFIKEDDRMHTLCQPCRESRQMWGDVRGRRLTIAETEAVMTGLVLEGPGFESLQELVQEAIARNLIEP